MAKRKKQLKRVVAYARVSTAEQAAKDLSIPAQLDALHRYAAEHGAAVVKQFEELGASGRTKHRPVFKEMLSFVSDRANEVDAILVYQTSRFFRDAAEARALKVALRRQGVEVIAICQETEDGPMGSFMEGIFELVDQYESDVNGMRTAAAMRKNAELGFVNGARAPFGYRAEHVQVGGQRKRKFVPNPSESATLVEVFRAYIAGQGAKAVANELNSRGLRYRNGGRWTKDHVLRVITEPACVGTYYWGRKDARTGRARDQADWIAIPVEPILEQELFDSAQRVRESRDPSKVKGRTLSSSLLLAGVARCKCGATLGLETSGKKTSNGERPFRYYNCRCFLKSGKSECAGVRVPEATLDRAVLEHLAEKVFTVERCRKILKDVVEETGMLRQRTAAERENLKAQLGDVERRIAKWTAAFEDNQADVAVVLPRLHELKAKRSDLQEALSKVVPLTKPPLHLYTEATLKRFQGMLREVFLSGQTSMTKNYLRFLVERIEVQPAPKRSVEVNIVGRSGAAVALIASSHGNPSPGGPVLGSVGSWLQR